MTETLSTRELVESLPTETRALILQILGEKYPPNSWILGGKCGEIMEEIANESEKGKEALALFFDSGMADKHEVLLGG